MQSLLVLGRQPEISLAEVVSLYGADKVILISKKVALVDIDPCLLAFDRLGGSVKFAKLLTIRPTTNLREVVDFLIESAPPISQKMPPGKMHLGLSLHGYQLPLKQLQQIGLKLKRSIAATGRSVHLVPNKDLCLTSAQVIHNHLTDQNGWELIIIKASGETYIGQTVKVQDISRYSKRDYGRPERRPKAGMLPPKLAQIMINLAAGQLSKDELSSICDIPAGQSIRPDLKETILDPFCGSGVILQEALLMGYRVVGSDRSNQMIEASKSNLDWLTKTYSIDQKRFELKLADATSAKWSGFSMLVSEIDLGPPLVRLPEPDQLNKMVQSASSLLNKFLNNLQPQMVQGSRICLALPAWQIRPSQFRFLPLIDQIENFGYNLVKFGGNLVYARANQLVGRHLIVAIKR